MALAQLAIAGAESVQTRALDTFDRLCAEEAVPREDIVALHRRLLWLNSVSAAVQQSTHPSLHPVISPTVQTLLRELKVDGQVLVSGADTLEAYELSTLGQDSFRELVHPKALAAVKTWPFLIFTIPRPPLDWALHYTLIVHEIGHAVFAARKIGDSLQLQVPSHLVNPLGALRPDSSRREVESLMLLAKQADDFAKIADDWIEELFADAFGLLMVGPAYVSAFCRVVGMSGRLDSATNTHPPAALRLHLMGRIVGPREYLKLLPPFAADAIRGWISESDQVHNVGPYRSRQGADGELQNLLPLLCKESERLHDQLVACAAEVLGERVHTVTAQNLDAERADRLARLSVPIVEQQRLPALDKPGQPLDVARVLAGHWIAYYKTAELKKTPESKPEADHTEIMSKYGDRLLGSLDAVEALRAWLEEQQ